MKEIRPPLTLKVWAQRVILALLETKTKDFHGSLVVWMALIRITTVLTLPDAVSPPGESNTTDNANCRPTAELAVTISESADPVVAGSGASNLVHTISVTNNGPQDATNIVIVFGANTFIAPALSFNNGSQGPGGNEWTIPALASGSTATMELIWTVGADYSDSDPIASSAFIQSQDLFDSDNTNNSASESTAVSYDVDLELSKSDSDVSAVPGDIVIYELAVTNSGVSNGTRCNIY